jgi:hypothetical protein
VSAEEAAWQRFADELAAWKAARLEPTLWWRDDDAGAPGAALSRLVALSSSRALPLALAAVPAWVGEATAGALAGAPVTVLQHGYAHIDHAAPGEKSCELGRERPAQFVVAEIALGRQKLETIFGPRFQPVMVPPWNRMAPYLTPFLAELRYIGLSQFGPRSRARPVAELVQANAHVDLVHWKSQPPRFAGTAKLLDELVLHLAARRSGEADRAEPTGILTHHAAHDEACWAFLEQFLLAARDSRVIRWIAPQEVFAAVPR